VPTEERILQFRDTLLTLLPEGKLWRLVKGGVFDRLLQTIASEGATIDEVITAVATEALPSQANMLLEGWEYEVGLPDPNFPSDVPLTLAERRDLVVAKLQAVGGCCADFFVALAARLGVTITITEFEAFEVGESAVEDPLDDETARFLWQVNAPDSVTRYFEVGESAVGDPLESGGNELLEVLLNSAKQAHTKIIFSYT